MLVSLYFIYCFIHQKSFPSFYVNMNFQDNNAIIRQWGDKRTESGLKNHVELVKLLGIADLDKGISFPICSI